MESIFSAGAAESIDLPADGSVEFDGIVPLEPEVPPLGAGVAWVSDCVG
jgi:hypothetical protein